MVKDIKPKFINIQYTSIQHAQGYDSTKNIIHTTSKGATREHDEHTWEEIVVKEI